MKNKPINQSNKSKMDRRIELFCKAHPAFSKLFPFVCLSVTYSMAITTEVLPPVFYIYFDKTSLLTIVLIVIYGLLSESVDEIINSADSETQIQEKPEKNTKII